MAGQATVMNQLLGQQRTQAPEIRSGESFGAGDQNSESALAQAMGGLNTLEGQAHSGVPEFSQPETNTDFAAALENVGKRSNTLNLREQLNMGASSTQYAGESLGMHGFAPSGNIFTGSEHQRGNKLARIRQQLPHSELASSQDIDTAFQQEADDLNIRALQEKGKQSSTSTAHEIYEQKRQARLKELNISLRQAQKQATSVSGANQSLNLHTDQYDNGVNVSDDQLRRVQMRTRQRTQRRQESIAHQIHMDRQRKIKQHRGGLEAMTGAPKVDMTAEIQRHAPHELTMGE